MTPEITVLKFGGSVLRFEKDLRRAVHEIYAHWRRGEQVLVVVSAFGGTTDALLAKTKLFGDEIHSEATAALVSTGEATSAAMLTMELDRSGIPSKLLTPVQVGIRTVGEDPINAEPVEANFDRIRTELESAIAVVSGFAGINDNDDVTLLGRGGTDYTALFLAHGLGGRCILLKDVDGLYDADPAFGNEARRFAEANYDAALKLGGELIQPRAVEFARDRSFAFEVTAIDTNSSTRIGNLNDRFAKVEVSRKGPLRIALLGCGTVGLGVYERLIALPESFELTGVVNLHPERAIERGVRADLVRRDALALIDQDCDVVIELIGGTEPAGHFIRHALQRGRHVITANKAVLSTDERHLKTLAHDFGVSISYGASVGGALPALEVARQLKKFRPRALRGIINGPCNFICDQLVSGVDLDAAVAQAQIEGFAEADPTLDLDGTDAAQKLILLARAAFGADLTLENIEPLGVTSLTPEIMRVARQNGMTYRLVAECRKTDVGLQASVRPTAVPLSDPLAKTNSAQNCLVIETDLAPTRIIRGRGAGRHATTEAVMADLFDLRRSLAQHSEFTPIPRAERTLVAGAAI